MANFELTQTGQEVQDILNQAPDTATDLGTEVTNRENADTALQNEIDDIETAIGTNETANTIKGRIAELETDVNNIETSLGNDETPETVKGRVKALEDDVDALESAVGTGGTVDQRIAAVVGDAGEEYNTLGKLEDKIQAEATTRGEADTAMDGRVDALETAVGTGGSVDERIATAKSEVLGDAGANYNTLGKLEDKIQEEATTRGNADTALQNSIDDINDAIGTDGTADTIKGRIAAVESEVSGVESEIGNNETAYTVKGRITTLENTVGTGGTVNERIATAKSEVIGDASTENNTLGKLAHKLADEVSDRQTAITNLVDNAGEEYNTLGKIEDKIEAEEDARVLSDTTLQGNIDDINDDIGTDGTTGTVKGRIAALEYDMNNAEGSVDTRIEAAKDEIRGDAAAGYNTLGKVEDRFQEFAADVDQRLDTQDAAIELLNGSEVIVVADHTAVTSPVNNVIYREQGVSSYSDWMWDTTVTPFAWKLLATYEPGIDDEPTPGSSNLVKSGGVAANIVYDISAANSGTMYADLAAALDSGNNIPASISKGGMSVKFVQSSDNKYVQYRLMATSFSTNESDWQGVDNEPVVNSDNLVKSGGVYDIENKIINAIEGYSLGYESFGTTGFYMADGSFNGNPYRTVSGIIPVNKGDVFEYKLTQSASVMMIAALNANKECVVASSIIGTEATTIGTYTVPDGIAYIQAQENPDYADSGDGIKCIFNAKLSLLETTEKANLIKAINNSVHLSERPLLKNSFCIDDIEVGKAINSSGVIFSASGEYKTVRLQVNAGKYYIKTVGPGTQHTLWKYSDSTYATPSAMIIGNVEANGVYELSAGYYALSWEKEGDISEFDALFVSHQFVDDAPVLGSPNVVLSNGIARSIENKPFVSEIYNRHPVGLEWNSDWAKLIYKSDGTTSNSAYRLKTGFIPVNKGDVFSYVLQIDPQFLSIAAFDKDYQLRLSDSIAGIDSQQLGNYTVPDGVMYLMFQTKIPSEDRNIVQSSVLYIGNIEAAKQFGLGNMLFSRELWYNIGATFTLDPEYKTAISTANGYSNRMAFIPEMFEDTFKMSCMITPITGDNDNYWEVVLGIEGSMCISVGVDSTGKFIKVNEISGNTVTAVKRIDASDLRIALNNPLSVEINKIADTINNFSVVVTDVAGKIISFNRPSEMDIWITLEGRPMFYTNVGTASYSNFYFGYNVDVNNVKVVVMGHSFVAGSTMIDTPTARFASRIRTAIGEKNVAIIGMGGIGVSNLLRNYLTSLYALRSARYVIIYIGYNDEDTSNITSQMQSFNDGIKAMGMMPIWLTPAPERDGSMNPRPNQKQYMMTYFNYVDVTEAFLDNNGNIDTNMYHDDVHPSAEGHERIYNLIRAKYGCIFNL